MFGLFSKRQMEIKSPIKGKVIDVSQVPDEVFSSKMVGDGFAIDPKDNTIYSPVEGEIIQVFPTGHAIGIKTKEGLEILIHIGIDTVELKGKGFVTFVNEGDYVRVGDKLITFDLELIKNKAKSTIIPVLITNMEKVKEMNVNFIDAEEGDVIANVRLK
ncbi:PTS sugar transporter subunit IIA [Caloramator sp. Dgby_cultured_2]|uniref:PTS sugar transporter subunit IIA n=1 Tax=Caloramator sp. Dgby_cultured_2 TaxID=3029174 RepID=UPI00237DAC93|nr:PTS glucose transporter subunit IIA [Caloramator sp. Dgby_cultured_2]WDU82795.1 PTS glucose transporter subunit IIA [Caloramator sp. Dgby_cultured_2]